MLIYGTIKDFVAGYTQPTSKDPRSLSKKDKKTMLRMCQICTQNTYLAAIGTPTTLAHSLYLRFRLAQATIFGAVDTALSMQKEIFGFS